MAAQYSTVYTQCWVLGDKDVLLRCILYGKRTVSMRTRKKFIFHVASKRKRRRYNVVSSLLGALRYGNVMHLTPIVGRGPSRQGSDDHILYRRARTPSMSDIACGVRPAGPRCVLSYAQTSGTSGPISRVDTRDERTGRPCAEHTSFWSSLQYRCIDASPLTWARSARYASAPRRSACSRCRA